MAVKVLVYLTVAMIVHQVYSDVSHLKLAASETNSADSESPVAIEGESEAEQKTSRLQSRNADFDSQQALETNAHEDGYNYEKPSIPFEPNNLDYDGYEYPKPANPMTYPPPSQNPVSTTDQTFPDATARYRVKKSVKLS